MQQFIRGTITNVSLILCIPFLIIGATAYILSAGVQAGYQIMEDWLSKKLRDL